MAIIGGIPNFQKFSDTTMSHSPHPTRKNTCAQVSAQGQVSARCEAATICRCRAYHLRWIFVGCRAHHMAICSVSTGQQYTKVSGSNGPRPWKSHAQFHFLDTGDWNPHLQKQEFIEVHFWHKGLLQQHNPRSCQMGPPQSEWPFTKKRATRCSGVWIG